jgi:hypothetical protein
VNTAWYVSFRLRDSRMRTTCFNAKTQGRFLTSIQNPLQTQQHPTGISLENTLKGAMSVVISQVGALSNDVLDISLNARDLEMLSQELDSLDRSQGGTPANVSDSVRDAVVQTQMRAMLSRRTGRSATGASGAPVGNPPAAQAASVLPGASGIASAAPAQMNPSQGDPIIEKFLQHCKYVMIRESNRMKAILLQNARKDHSQSDCDRIAHLLVIRVLAHFIENKSDFQPLVDQLSEYFGCQDDDWSDLVIDLVDQLFDAYVEFMQDGPRVEFAPQGRKRAFPDSVNFFVSCGFPGHQLCSTELRLIVDTDERLNTIDRLRRDLEAASKSDKLTVVLAKTRQFPALLPKVNHTLLESIKAKITKSKVISPNLKDMETESHAKLIQSVYYHLISRGGRDNVDFATGGSTLHLEHIQTEAIKVYITNFYEVTNKLFARKNPSWPAISHSSPEDYAVLLASLRSLCQLLLTEARTKVDVKFLVHYIRTVVLELKIHDAWKQKDQPVSAGSASAVMRTVGGEVASLAAGSLAQGNGL